ncbi:MAG: hypothetical protein NT178_04020 [Proteobacteria bacterium]|nr:hypothetical protein [Pseudomonadota bacterium]
MSDYDDEKPDWREIDRRKDSSRQYGRQENTNKKEMPKDRWNVARRKEALDRLFMGEKGTIEHEKLFNKIHKSYGSGSFIVNVKKYIEKYGIPDDVSTLLLILDTKEQDIVFKTFDKITTIYNGLSPRQKEDVRRKLSILKLTDRSSEVRGKAEDTLQTIQ